MHRAKLIRHRPLARNINLINLRADQTLANDWKHVCELLWSHELFVYGQELTIRFNRLRMLRHGELDVRGLVVNGSQIWQLLCKHGILVCWDLDLRLSWVVQVGVHLLIVKWLMLDGSVLLCCCVSVVRLVILVD